MIRSSILTSTYWKNQVERWEPTFYASQIPQRWLFTIKSITKVTKRSQYESSKKGYVAFLIKKCRAKIILYQKLFK